MKNNKKMVLFLLGALVSSSQVDAINPSLSAFSQQCSSRINNVYDSTVTRAAVLGAAGLVLFGKIIKPAYKLAHRKLCQLKWIDGSAAPVVPVDPKQAGEYVRRSELGAYVTNEAMKKKLSEYIMANVLSHQIQSSLDAFRTQHVDTLESQVTSIKSTIAGLDKLYVGTGSFHALSLNVNSLTKVDENRVLRLPDLDGTKVDIKELREKSEALHFNPKNPFVTGTDLKSSVEVGLGVVVPNAVSKEIEMRQLVSEKELVEWKVKVQKAEERAVKAEKDLAIILKCNPKIVQCEVDYQNKLVQDKKKKQEKIQEKQAKITEAERERDAEKAALQKKFDEQAQKRQQQLNDLGVKQKTLGEEIDKINKDTAGKYKTEDIRIQARTPVEAKKTKVEGQLKQKQEYHNNQTKPNEEALGAIDAKYKLKIDALKVKQQKAQDELNELNKSNEEKEKNEKK